MLETQKAEAETEMSPEERRELDLVERELKREVLQVGPVGPISKAAREWLQRNQVTPQAAQTPPEAKVWGPDLVTPEEIRKRVEDLVRRREMLVQAAAARKAASKKKRVGGTS
ncbi:hypothetical protein C8R47DRAFT_1213648 [Mycena vitilis]|nr:hypothetical protein C8R47DRAFT_1215988 [Mycena vitilis]KAJ6493961.1 hypothetical protein C8R47DRAFT_1213648 [Mycena vitilis]